MSSAAAPATGKRERTKRANREAILAAARRVFSDIGYGAASVRDIVRGTDLASGTFYNYFPDKEAALRAPTSIAPPVSSPRCSWARSCTWGCSRDRPPGGETSGQLACC